MHPKCDFLGKCRNKAYREVYPMLMKGRFKRRGWSYLCRKHYYQEQKRFKGKLPNSDINREISVIRNYKSSKLIS